MKSIGRRDRPKGLWINLNSIKIWTLTLKINKLKVLAPVRWSWNLRAISQARSPPLILQRRLRRRRFNYSRWRRSRLQAFKTIYRGFKLVVLWKHWREMEELEFRKPTKISSKATSKAKIPFWKIHSELRKAQQEASPKRHRSPIWNNIKATPSDKASRTPDATLWPRPQRSKRLQTKATRAFHF